MKLEIEIKDKRLVEALIEYSIGDSFKTTYWDDTSEDKYLHALGKAIKEKIIEIVDTDELVQETLKKWLTDEQYIKKCVKEVIRYHSGEVLDEINNKLQTIQS